MEIRLCRPSRDTPATVCFIFLWALLWIREEGRWPWRVDRNGWYHRLASEVTIFLAVRNSVSGRQLAVGSWQLAIGSERPPTAFCLLPSAFCLLPSAFYQLPSAF